MARRWRAHFEKMAEDWLSQQSTRTPARAARGPLADMGGMTCVYAAGEYLRYATEDRGCKPSTVRAYRSLIRAQTLPAFGPMRLEDIDDSEIERWRAGLTGARTGPAIANKTAT